MRSPEVTLFQQLRIISVDKPDCSKRENRVEAMRNCSIFLLRHIVNESVIGNGGKQSVQLPGIKNKAKIRILSDEPSGDSLKNTKGKESSSLPFAYQHGDDLKIISCDAAHRKHLVCDDLLHDGCIQNAATVGRRHSLAEPVFVFSFSVRRLKCSFHM